MGHFVPVWIYKYDSCQLIVPGHCNYQSSLNFTEPGYYQDNEFGIRLETIVRVIKAETEVGVTVYCLQYVHALQWRHNGCHSVSNHRRLDCLLKHLFRRKSKKALKLRVTGLCEGNSPVTGEFPAQRASNMENVSIWWCHYHSRGAYSGA